MYLTHSSSIIPLLLTCIYLPTQEFHIFLRLLPYLEKADPLLGKNNLLFLTFARVSYEVFPLSLSSPTFTAYIHSYFRFSYVFLFFFHPLALKYTTCFHCLPSSLFLTLYLLFISTSFRFLSFLVFILHSFLPFFSIFCLFRCIRNIPMLSIFSQVATLTPLFSILLHSLSKLICIPQ